MIGLDLVLAVLIAAAVQTPQTRIESVPLGRIDIPDEIAPAITPYFDCQMASRGVRMGAPGSGQTAPLAEQRGIDCSAIRGQVSRRAESMLRDQRRGTASERRAFVERVLANVDIFAAAAGAPVAIHRRPAMGPPLDIPDELAPALQPYLDCLGTSAGAQLRNERGVVPPPPGIVRGSDCSAYRERAQVSGDRLLEQRGVRNPEERRRRIEAVLVTIDDYMREMREQIERWQPNEEKPDAEDR